VLRSPPNDVTQLELVTESHRSTIALDPPELMLCRWVVERTGAFSLAEMGRAVPDVDVERAEELLELLIEGGLLRSAPRVV
jgi:hypothetical protein